METTGSRREVVITVIPDDTRSKRSVDLRFSARAEIYAHVAQCLHEASALPDDGQPMLMLITDDAMRPTYTRIDHHDECPGMTHGTLVARVAPLSAAELREVLLGAWIVCPSAVEAALGELNNEQPYCGKQYRAPSGEMDYCAEPIGHDGDCGDQPRNAFPEDRRADPPASCGSWATCGDQMRACGNIPGHEDKHYFARRRADGAGTERWEWTSGGLAVRVSSPDEPQPAPARVGVPERMPVPASHYCDSGNCEVCGDGTGDGYDGDLSGRTLYEDPGEADGFGAAEAASAEAIDAQERAGLRAAR
jgi:hypothetical protein